MTVTQDLFTQLAKDSPISIWLPGLEEECFTTLKSYLMGERNVFEHPAESAKLNANFPYLTHIISEIKCLKDGPFLPAEVSKVFFTNVTLWCKVQCVSNHTLCVKSHTMCKITHCV